jgi:hypothetical protein
MAAAGEGLSLATVDAQERPETVMLDLVNPAAARRRLCRKYRNLGRNERRRGGGIAGHEGG